MKKIMYILTIVLSFALMENINASYYCGIDDKTDTCVKKTYKYDKQGNAKDFEMTIGIYHIKRTDKSNPNQEIIYSFDTCTDPDVYKKHTKYCEKIFRADTYNGGNGQTAINVSSDTEIYPIAICMQPGVLVNDQNVNKYVYFTEEDINNNKANCSEEYIFYSEEGVQESNKVCTKIKDITMDVGYIADYSISTKVIGGATCELNIKYKNTTTDSERVKIDNDGNTERCNLPSGYKLVYKDKIGDPLHPTGYLWELQHCKAADYSPKLSFGFICTLENVKDSSDTIQMAFVHNTAVAEQYRSKNYNYIHSIAINNNIVKKMVYKSFTDEMCPSYIYYMYNTAYIDSNGTAEHVVQEENQGNRYTKYKLVSAFSKQKIYKDDIRETGVPKDWTYKDGSLPGEGDTDKDSTDNTENVGFLDLKDKEVMCNGYAIPYGIPYIVYKVINLIKILTPIILIVLGLIDFSKAVMAGHEDEMKKSQARFIKRVIAAIIIFFVIAMVQFAFNLLGDNDAFSCFSCFVSGEDCNIVTKE